MLLEGWGRHPRIEAEAVQPRDSAGARAALKKDGPLTPRGLGRSYGDSALGSRALLTEGLDLLLGFDPSTGVLNCQAGVSLDEILRVFVPKGWFPPVTPGTKYVTVGGAIAADVHGKSHTATGCFSECVLDFDLMLADARVVTCSRDSNAELFHATCGGMGLTGAILRATLRLAPIASSFIEQTTLKAGGLDELLEGFEAAKEQPFTVAWVDCLSRGKALGRSLLTAGDFSKEGGLCPHAQPRLSMPVVPPWSLVNPLSSKAFNFLNYHHVLRKRSRARVHYEPFFYPLDKVLHWNRAYGPSGFTQYQFVIPTAAGPEGLRGLLDHIAASGRGSFLAVLKLMGAANANPLSFPLAGYTLAVDFKLERGLFELLNELDARVMDLGGRVYLAKDVRLAEASFKRMYPRWEEFQALREKTGAKGRFASVQSKRLGLD